MKLEIEMNDSAKNIISNIIGINRATRILNTVIKSDKVIKNSRILIVNGDVDDGDIVSFEIINGTDPFPICIGNFDVTTFNLFIFNRNKSNKTIQLNKNIQF